jgi:DNA-binding NarL/FixJ family response regulator
MAIVHAHEGMRFGIKTWLEQAGVAKVVLEQDCPKGLLNALPPAGVQVLLLYVGLSLHLALEAVEAVRRRFAGTAVLLVGEWTEPMIGRTLDVEVQGLLHSATRMEEFTKAVLVTGNNGVYFNLPMRMRRKMERKHPAEGKGPLKLTAKEQKVLTMIGRADEPTYKVIAEELHKSLRTVESHRDNLFRKFEVHSRGKLKDAARDAGMLPLR